MIMKPAGSYSIQFNHGRNHWHPQRRKGGQISALFERFKEGQYSLSDFLMPLNIKLDFSLSTCAFVVFIACPNMSWSRGKLISWQLISWQLISWQMRVTNDTPDQQFLAYMYMYLRSWQCNVIQFLRNSSLSSKPVHSLTTFHLCKTTTANILNKMVPSGPALSIVQYVGN